MINKINNFKQDESGFTLIELLVVILIIGVLAAIAIPVFLNQQKAAIRSGVQSDVKTAQTAITTYLATHPNATSSEMQSDVEVLKTLGANKSSHVNTRLDRTGDWTNWRLTGSNTAAGANGALYTFNFDSATGKYWETGK
jgi:type IV pilus assembly protein PilA